jgi:outer membrane protein assembly factor BamD (BamD/ComL family)
MATVAAPATRAAAPSDISAEPAAPATTAKPNVPSVEEARQIEAARAAVARGDNAGAIAQLNDYDASYPNGTLKPESMALRIQALSKSGKVTEARALANEFEAKYPSHPLLSR